MTKQDEFKKLLLPLLDLELAVLIGSQASVNVIPQSDWDIAVRWKKISVEQRYYNAWKY